MYFYLIIDLNVYGAIQCSEIYSFNLSMFWSMWLVSHCVWSTLDILQVCNYRGSFPSASRLSLLGPTFPFINVSFSPAGRNGLFAALQLMVKATCNLLKFYHAICSVGPTVTCCCPVCSVQSTHLRLNKYLLIACTCLHLTECIPTLC